MEVGEHARHGRGFWRLAKTIFKNPKPRVVYTEAVYQALPSSSLEVKVRESETLSPTPETGVLPDLRIAHGGFRIGNPSDRPCADNRIW